jgi:hypothetical protein
VNLKDFNFKHAGTVGVAVVRIIAVLGVIILMVVPVVVASLAMLVGIIVGRRQLYALELADKIFDVFHKVLAWKPGGDDVDGDQLDEDIKKLLG